MNTVKGEKNGKVPLDDRIACFQSQADQPLSEVHWHELFDIVRECNLRGAKGEEEYYKKALALTEPRLEKLTGDFPSSNVLKLLRFHAVASIRIGDQAVEPGAHGKFPQDYLTETLIWARSLRRSSESNLARRLLESRVFAPLRGAEHWSIADGVLFDELRSEMALCTALSSDVPPVKRLQQALDVLRCSARGVPGRLAPDDDSLSGITLHIAGTIHKKMWELMLTRSELEKAACFYEAAFRRALRDNPLEHAVYSAAEAAIQYDALASLLAESHHGQFANHYREHALSIRKEMVEQLENVDVDLNFRALVDLALIYLGLSDQKKAEVAIDQAVCLSGSTEPWRRRGGAAQLVELGRIRPGLSKKANRLASRLFNQDADGTISLHGLVRPKLGLALSGGGFRASFYHLGVLAALGEYGLLQHVEILSCVSGGSIVGTLYYRELATMLDRCHESDDPRVIRDEYLQLVRSVIEKFKKGTDQNLRLSVMHPSLLKHGTTTARLGELFDNVFYAGSDQPTKLQDLKIRFGNDEFHPAHDNWKRDRKVPELFLNATSLNTGHNWQFTATFMGESPASIDPMIDATDRLRRMYLKDEAPDSFRAFPLGAAVSASACVPSLFEPLSLEGLYATRSGERHTVRLVDGGVHDNQGIASLVDNDCRVLLVSDASGQLGTEVSPSPWWVGSTLRSNSILMERVRQLQYRELEARRQAGLLDALVFVHLKQGVEGQPVDWENCDDPKASNHRKESLPCDSTGTCQCEKTSYGVLVDLQSKLAELRTDLDVFSDAEADALMYSGYAAMRYNIAKAAEGSQAGAERFRDLLIDDAPKTDWRFLWLEEYLTHCSRPGGERVHTMLDLGRHRFFRPLRLGYRLLRKQSKGASARARKSYVQAPARFGMNILLGTVGYLYAWSTRLNNHLMMNYGRRRVPDRRK